MPRPKVERRPRALRLPAVLDDALVAAAAERSISVTAAITEAIVGWLPAQARSKVLAALRPTPIGIEAARTRHPRRDVTPFFKDQKTRR